MEIRKTKIIINKSKGNSGSGSVNYKIALPSKWINELEISNENSYVNISFDGEQIVIKKEVPIKKFISLAMKNKHNIKRLNYYNGNELCTSIYADFTNKSIRVENENKPNILLAFGKNDLPTWDDFENFLAERCVPKSRDGLKYYMDELGVSEYSPFEIIKKTNGRVAEDNQWLEVIDFK